jgi:prepilin signal peptidase PulO-like enzyme (type II secretory pathway)
MNKYQTGLVVQGAGVLMLAVAVVHLIKAQPFMTVLVVGSVVTYLVGDFMKKSG